MVHASWDDSPDCQTPLVKPLPDFCFADKSHRGTEVNVRSEGVHNEQVSAVSANGAEKAETRIGTLKAAFTGAPLPRKNVLPYTDDVVNDSSPITLSNEGLSGTAEVEMTNASSEMVSRGIP